MLVFAGLGLNEKTITNEIIEEIKDADKIYFERYTSPVSYTHLTLPTIYSV